MAIICCEYFLGLCVCCVEVYNFVIDLKFYLSISAVGYRCTSPWCGGWSDQLLACHSSIF